MRLRTLLFSGFALLVTSVFINFLVTLFLIAPGPIQLADSFSSILNSKDKEEQYAKLSVEKDSLEQELLQTRKLHTSSEKDLEKLQDELANANSELDLTKSDMILLRDSLEASTTELTELKKELDTAQKQIVAQDENSKLVKIKETPDEKLKKRRKERVRPCECNNDAFIRDINELRAGLETEFGFRDGIFGELIPEKVNHLKRNVVPLHRVDGRKFTYEQFWNEYAMTQTPVIVSNYGSKMFAVNWTLDFIADHCGDESVILKHFDTNAKTWGNLFRDREPTNVRDFIGQVKEGTAGNSYLFDWGIPSHCPSMLKSFSVPKYFAPDYFQRIPDDVWQDGGYKHSWPSLFIGTGDTRSGLHIDAVQSHFWMGMIAGRKRWGVVTPDHVPYLYPSMEASTFDIEDIFDVDVTKWPLASKATIWEGVIGPGDLIYVPGGSAHQIRNLETIVSVSMNYIDEENFKRSTNLLANSYPDIADYMLSKKFTRGLSSKQRDLPWKEYKTFPRNEEYDIFVK